MKISEIPEEIRHVMLFYYRKAKSGAKTCRKICAVYGANAVTERTVQLWFNRFRTGNFDVKDAPRSGRPITAKADEILQMIELDRHATCQGIADTLGINHQTVWNHVKKAVYKKIQKQNKTGKIKTNLKKLVSSEYPSKAIDITQNEF